MIKPEGIPVFLGNLARVSQAATDLSAVGKEIVTIAQGLERTFSTSMQANYRKGPESDRLIAAMLPVKLEGEKFGPELDKVARALHEFVGEAQQHVNNLGSVKNRAHAFIAEVGGRPQDEIDDDKALVEKENKLHTDLQSALDGFQGAERRCANKIAALYGGRKWDEKTGHREGDPPPPEAKEDEEPPWGTPLEYDAPWYEDCLDFVGGVLKGIFVDGILGTLDALTTLIPIQPLLKSMGVDSIFGHELKGWKECGQAWVGVGLTVASAAMWAIPGASALMHVAFPETAAFLDNVGLTVLKGMVAWDMWGEDPGRALGQVGFNVITTVGTGGAGAAVRGAAIAGKYGSVAAKVATGAEVAMNIAGKLRPGQLAINTALKLPKVSDLVIKVGNSPTLGGLAKLGGLDIPTSKGGTPNLGGIDSPSVSTGDRTPATVGGGSHSGDSTTSTTSTTSTGSGRSDGTSTTSGHDSGSSSSSSGDSSSSSSDSSSSSSGDSSSSSSDSSSSSSGDSSSSSGDRGLSDTSSGDRGSTDSSSGDRGSTDASSGDRGSSDTGPTRGDSDSSTSGRSDGDSSSSSDTSGTSHRADSDGAGTSHRGDSDGAGTTHRDPDATTTSRQPDGHSPTRGEQSPTSHGEPSRTHSEPSRTHSEPTRTHSEPSRTHSEPTHTHSEPSRTHSEPTRTHTEPTRTHTEPTRTHTEPTRTEPTRTEPTRTEPTRTEPTHTDPVRAADGGPTRTPDAPAPGRGADTPPVAPLHPTYGHAGGPHQSGTGHGPTRTGADQPGGTPHASRPAPGRGDSDSDSDFDWFSRPDRDAPSPTRGDGADEPRYRDTGVLREPGHRNEARWIVDQHGRPRTMQARLRDVLPGKQRHTAEQKKAADRGNPGDEGGHGIGHRYFADQKAEQMFPQAGNFNKGAYKRLENEWAAWIKKGHEVDVRVTPMPPGKARPDQIQVTYDVINPRTGRTVWSSGRNFDNRGGVKFERYPSKSVKNFNDPEGDVFTPTRSDGPDTSGRADAGHGDQGEGFARQQPHQPGHQQQGPKFRSQQDSEFGQPATPAIGHNGQDRHYVEPDRYDTYDPDGRLTEDLKNSVGDNPVRNVDEWVKRGNPHYRTDEAPVTNNCGDNSRSFLDTLQGREPRLANADLRKPPGEYREMHEYTGIKPDPIRYNGIDGNQNPAEYTARAMDDVRRSLEGKPPGTGAIIGGAWHAPAGTGLRPPGGGHWFNAFVDEKGVVRWADQQSGDTGPWPPPYNGNFRELEVMVREPGGEFTSPLTPAQRVDPSKGIFPQQRPPAQPAQPTQTQPTQTQPTQPSQPTPVDNRPGAEGRVPEPGEIGRRLDPDGAARAREAQREGVVPEPGEIGRRLDPEGRSAQTGSEGPSRITEALDPEGAARARREAQREGVMPEPGEIGQRLDPEELADLPAPDGQSRIERALDPQGDASATDPADKPWRGGEAT